jgi:aspartate dehydrogenase
MPDRNPNRELTLAIAGLGAIGTRVATAVDAGSLPGFRLVAASARDHAAATERLAGLRAPPEVVDLAELAGLAEVIVECAPAAVFAEVARPAITRGRILMPLSVGALLSHMDLVDRARETGARIVVPTGALIGLDTVRAMAEGEIKRVVLETRKPPAGLAGAPHLKANDIDISNLTEAVRVFHGSAREAAKGFPANVNVAAALALAGIGPDRTEVEIWADPGIDRNIQSVTITSDAGEATMTMRNIPSANPKTGRIVAQSVLATLRRLTAPMVAGT